MIVGSSVLPILRLQVHGVGERLDLGDQGLLAHVGLDLTIPVVMAQVGILLCGKLAGGPWSRDTWR
jgi:hypothetical protein